LSSLIAGRPRIGIEIRVSNAAADNAGWRKEIQVLEGRGRDSRHVISATSPCAHCGP